MNDKWTIETDGTLQNTKVLRNGEYVSGVHQIAFFASSVAGTGKSMHLQLTRADEQDPTKKIEHYVF